MADDDDDLRATLVELLLADGWEVVEAVDGEHAVHQARVTRPDVILLDYRMPKKTGKEVFHDLRSDGLDVPVVLITAATDVQRLARDLGLEHYLGKPFGIDELGAVLERAIAARRDGAS